LAQTFSAVVGDWARRVEGVLDVIFRESCQQLVEELNRLVPVDTGALRASLRASTSAMPQIVQSGGVPPADLGEVILVIEGLEAGETLFLGYGMNYASFVHYGTSNMAGRPWVDLCAQRWPAIVAEVAARVKSRLGL